MSREEAYAGWLVNNSWKQNSPNEADRSEFETVSSAYAELRGPGQSPPVEAPDQGFARNALQGALLGWGDEATAGLAAGAAALFGDANYSDAYQDILESERQKVADYRVSNPGSALAAELAGGLLTGGASGARIAKMAPQAFKGWRGVAPAMGVGGVEGAVYGAGSAAEGERAGGAAKGAFEGAVGAGLLGTGVQTAASTINVAKNIAHTMGWGQNAANIVRKIIEDSGATLDDVQAWIAKNADAKPTIADFNESLRQAARYTSKAIGEAAEMGKQYSERARGGVDRVMEPIRRAMGGADEAGKVRSALVQTRKEQAGPLYDEAFDLGLPEGNTQMLVDVFEELKQQKPALWRKAQKTGALRAFAETGERIDKEALGKALPNLRGWQALTQELDDEISKAMRTTGRGASEVVPLLKIRKKITDELYRQNPAYQKANALFANTKRAEDLMDAGEELFRQTKSSHAERLLDDVDELPPEERRLVILGFVEAVQDKLGNIDVSRSPVSGGGFMKPNMQEKMRRLMGDELYSDFFETLNRELDYKRTEGLVRMGSDTHTQQMVAGQLGLGGSVRLNELPTSARSVVAQGVKRMFDQMGKLPDSVRDDVGKIIMTQNPDLGRLGLLNARPPTPPTPISPSNLPYALGAGLLGGRYQ